MSEWQPIETCDIEKFSMSPGVIVWNGKTVTAAWYDDGWRDNIDAPDFYDAIMDPQPTHWMPFPEPPTNLPGGK